MSRTHAAITFSTLTGAGFGLLAWLAVLGRLGHVQAGDNGGLTALALALALIVVGLLAATRDREPGQPLAAMLRDWRGSWRSRTAIGATITLLALWLMGMFWLGEQRVHGLAWPAAAGALAAVWCTGMIYQSDRATTAWAVPLVVPSYIALALATGGILFNLVQALAGARSQLALGAAVAALVIAWLVKAAYWSRIDAAPQSAAVPSAERAEFIRQRGMVTALLFLIPALVMIGLIAAGPRVGPLPMLVATASAAIGITLERWLFFAEAGRVTGPPARA